MFDLKEALTADRIDWSRIEAEGHSIEAIMIEAGQYGDAVLVKRARRAIERRAQRRSR